MFPSVCVTSSTQLYEAVHQSSAITARCGAVRYGAARHGAAGGNRPYVPVIRSHKAAADVARSCCCCSWWRCRRQCDVRRPRWCENGRKPPDDRAYDWECSYHSSHLYLSWPHFIWTGWQWVRCEATQFAVAATNRNEVGRTVLYGSLHSALTTARFKWNKVS